MALGPFSAKDHVVITTLGLEFAVAVALGTGGGYWADRHYATAPWLTIIGVFAGFALGMYIIVKEARRMGRTTTSDKNGKNNGSI